LDLLCDYNARPCSEELLGCALSVDEGVGPLETVFAVFGSQGLAGYSGGEVVVGGGKAEAALFS